MRVYVAAKLEEKDVVRQAYARLRAAGHEISHDWTTRTARTSPAWRSTATTAPAPREISRECAAAMCSSSFRIGTARANGSRWAPRSRSASA